MSRREDYPEDEGEEISGFRETEPDQNAPVALLTPKTMAVFFTVGVSITFLLAVSVYLSSRGVERRPPTIYVTETFKALTLQPSEVEILVEDRESGLQAVSVTVRQNDGQKPITVEIVNKIFSREPRFGERITLDAAKLGLKDGAAELIVQGWDDSAWNNRTVVTRDFVVDTQPPQLALVHASESMVEGGTAVAVYHARDANIVRSGVELADGTFFEGAVASLADAAFNGPDTYVSIFTIPKDVSGKTRIIAQDVAANVVGVPLSVSLERRQAGPVHRILVPDFTASQSILNLFSSVAPNLKDVDQNKVQSLLASGRQGERSAEVGMAKMLVGAAKTEHFKQLRELVKVGVRDPGKWKMPVQSARPLSEVKFGDVVTLADPNGELVSWVSEGEEFDVLTGADYIIAPFAGTVRFAQNLGIYGSSILLDHGAGVSSFHYSLNSLFVDWGANVELGQRIGQIGATGFHFSRQARFMILLQGIPVDTQDWIDPKRYTKVVEGPLNGAKQKLNLPVARSGVPL